MREKEKIKRYYKNMGIIVQDVDIENIMKDKERTNGIIRLYQKEEIDAMNYIFGKSKDNNKFSKFELEAANKIDLFAPNVVRICKIIYDNKDNEEKVHTYLNELRKVAKSE